MGHETELEPCGVLVAEPDAEVRRLAIERLSSAGYIASGVSTARDVVRLIAAATSYDSRVALPEVFVLSDVLFDEDIDLLGAIDVAGGSHRMMVLTSYEPLDGDALVDDVASLAGDRSARPSRIRAIRHRRPESSANW